MNILLCLHGQIGHTKSAVYAAFPVYKPFETNARNSTTISNSNRMTSDYIIILDQHTPGSCAGGLIIVG